MDTRALFAVYLGGDPPDGRMGEDHEVVFVVGDDIKDVRRRARAKWRGAGVAHVDAVQRLDRVDGFDITLSAGDSGDVMELDPEYHDADLPPSRARRQTARKMPSRARLVRSYPLNSSARPNFRAV